MNPELRDAYEALDRARIPAWREWSARLRRLKREGWPFDDAFVHATYVLKKTLQPYYDAVTRACGINPLVGRHTCAEQPVKYCLACAMSARRK